MIFGTRPHGHRPRLCSFVTFTPSSSQVNTGVRARLRSQDGVPQQQEAAPLSLPQLNRLFEASFARDENSVSTAGIAVIPSQFKVTQQILLHC
jgi:hypothetical protein